MKKALLLTTFFLAMQVQSQIFISENFSSLNVGEVGTDITLTNPGQGGWLTGGSNGTAPTTTTNSGNSNYQIITTDAPYGNVLQITGPNGDKGNRLFRKSIASQWTARQAGNNILEIEFSFFTGPETGSVNYARVYISDVSQTRILAGFGYSLESRSLFGLAYYDATSTGGQIGNYGFNLDNNPNGRPIPADTWVTLGMSYNFTTGQVRWKDSNGLNAAVQGASPSTNVLNVDFNVITGTNTTANPPVINAAEGIFWYDNISVRASSTDTLLDVAELVTPTSFVAYPNPVKNILYIDAQANLNDILVTDMNGRELIRHQGINTLQTAIDLSGLSEGIYLLTVKSALGEETKKIVKQ